MYFAGQTIDDNDDFDSKMYQKTRWTPPPWGLHKDLQARAHDFSLTLQTLFQKKRGKSNLLPQHRRALRELQEREDLMIVQCDKNLGPAVIERDTYIRTAFRDHLHDTKVYKLLNPFQAALKVGQIKLAISKWIEKHANSVNSHCKKYMKNQLKSNQDPYSYLYLTMKVHKNKTPVPSRPICSCSGSLLEPLGHAVNKLLQPFAQTQPYYLKNSADLKLKLEALGTLPPNTYLFTADAQSMYTNLPIDHAIQCIKQYLLSQNNTSIPIQAIVSGLKLLMRNNLFKFGDCIFLQQDGTAMGTPPAPPVAQISFGTHEINIIPLYTTNILGYWRYIDDVFGIWTTDPDAAIRLDTLNWTLFKATMNEFPGLTWDFTDRSKSVDFLDLTISIGDDNRIHTTLYEKPLNLHLYLPPHSSHPPGVLLGLIYGNIRRIYTLCSDPGDKIARTREMLQHLLARGYKSPDLLPIFSKAIQKATGAYTGPPREKLVNPVFLHLRYHPGDPPAHAIQQAWQDHVASPRNKVALADLRNYKKTKSGMSRLIIAYSRPHNLGNLLSYRKLPDGPPASSFMNE